MRARPLSVRLTWPVELFVIVHDCPTSSVGRPFSSVHLAKTISSELTAFRHRLWSGSWAVPPQSVARRVRRTDRTV